MGELRFNFSAQPQRWLRVRVNALESLTAQPRGFSWQATELAFANMVEQGRTKLSDVSIAVFEHHQRQPRNTTLLTGSVQVRVKDLCIGRLDRRAYPSGNAARRVEVFLSDIDDLLLHLGMVGKTTDCFHENVQIAPAPSIRNQCRMLKRTQIADLFL